MTPEQLAAEIVAKHFNKARREWDTDVQVLQTDIAAALQPSEAVKMFLTAYDKYHAYLSGSNNDYTSLNQLADARNAVRKELGL